MSNGAVMDSWGHAVLFFLLTLKFRSMPPGCLGLTRLMLCFLGFLPGRLGPRARLRERATISPGIAHSHFPLPCPCRVGHTASPSGFVSLLHAA